MMCTLIGYSAKSIDVPTPWHGFANVEAVAVPGVGSVAHDRDGLIDRRRVSRVALTLVPGRPPDVKGRQRRPAVSSNCTAEDMAPSLGELDV
jgi:hypothetical protein